MPADTTPHASPSTPPTLRSIASWLTDATLYEAPAASTRALVEAAVAAGVDLTAANLRDANLTDADLRGATLADADLRGADLTHADLRGADLTDANLTDATLTDANLTDATLTRANLTAANLTAATLTAATTLTRATLTLANLTAIRDDLHAVLALAPAEVPALLAALRAGRVNGQLYEGSCACLVGTLANARHCSYLAIPGLVPDPTRPAERWFLAIAPGERRDGTASAAVTAITVAWVEEWIAAHLVHSGDAGHEWAPHEREGWSVCSRCGLVRNYDRETPCRGVMPEIQPRDGGAS